MNSRTSFFSSKLFSKLQGSGRVQISPRSSAPTSPTHGTTAEGYFDLPYGSPATQDSGGSPAAVDQSDNSFANFEGTSMSVPLLEQQRRNEHPETIPALAQPPFERKTSGFLEKPSVQFPTWMRTPSDSQSHPAHEEEKDHINIPLNEHQNTSHPQLPTDYTLVRFCLCKVLFPLSFHLFSAVTSELGESRGRAANASFSITGGPLSAPECAGEVYFRGYEGTCDGQ